MLYEVDISGKQISELEPRKFADLGVKERFDIEEWIEKSPEVLGEDLLVIYKELTLASGKRLDLLAIDNEANLVVIELKRDKSNSTVELQAITYTSYCSRLTAKDIYSYYAKYLGKDTDIAKRQIKEFIDEELDDEELEDILNRNQRIILVAGEFHPDAISTVLWLLTHDVDIRCIRLEIYTDRNNNLLLNPDAVLPLPEVGDILSKQIREKKPVDPIIKSYEDKGVFTDSVLEDKLRETLSWPTELTPRFVKLLEILLSEDRVFSRSEVLQKLFEMEVGSDIGQTGRYLSGLSQFLTKKKNSHLRQVIEYTSTHGPGSLKDNYKIVSKYRDMIKSLIEQWKKDKSISKPSISSVIQ